MSFLIERSSDTPLRPRDVAADNIHQAFGSRDAEVAAIYIVRFCQGKGNWKPFTFQALLDLCIAAGDQLEKAKNRLTEGLTTLTLGEFIRRDGDLITLSTAFVARCYLKSPARVDPKKRIRVRKKKSTDSVFTRLLNEDLLGEKPEA